MAVWPVAAPRTWVGGELVDAATMNTEIRDHKNQIAAGSVAVDQVQIAGQASAPGASASGKAVVYFDTTLGELQVSRSTDTYAPLSPLADENMVIAMEVFG